MVAVPPQRQTTPLGQALEERYLAYALSTIMHRALPDVRDGLKPVHRRLLFAMRQLHLGPGAGFKKSARVVGDVIGRFHPHGDQAVYETLVRLAQDFSARYPLIDGQGNFGSLDGDNAAAMRYTESRLTAAAQRLLEGLDEDSVDFQPTYDGSDTEPVVMPAGFPNLLANGAAGIAVGMATSIPPHNVVELCAAALHLVRHPRSGAARLQELVPGPDFPTGGVIVESAASMRQAYETGQGGFRLRARWSTETGPRGDWRIVITEIPYQVRKSRLVQKLAGLIRDKALPLADVMDESAQEIRLVLVPASRTANPAQLMEAVFRQTELEVRVPLNLRALDATRTPVLFCLRRALQAWLDHRREVLERRARFRLGRIAARLETLAGLLVVHANLDRVIAIIRESDDPGAELMAVFGITQGQAETILNMRLRALRRLEETALRREHKALMAEARRLRALVKSAAAQWTRVADDIKALKAGLSKDPDARRRSTFAAPPPDVPAAAVREPLTVICSQKGWIWTTRAHMEPAAAPASAMRIPGFRLRKGDTVRFFLHAHVPGQLLLCATNGRFYTLDTARLPGGRGSGEPVRLLVDMAGEDDIVSLFAHAPGEKTLVASSDGYGFLAPQDGLLSSRRAGRQTLNLAPGAEVAACAPGGGDHVAVLGDNAKLLIFPAAGVREMTQGRGVRLQRYAIGGLADAVTFNLAPGLDTRDSAGRRRTFTDLGDWLRPRASAGRRTPRGFPRSGRFGLAAR